MKNLAKKTNEQGHQLGQSAAYAWNKRILVVEDEKEVARAYMDILAPQSNVIQLRSSRKNSSMPQPGVSGPEFEIEVVHSADEALIRAKLAKNNGTPFAMGFFDVLLGPGSDGFELFREIHEFDPSLFAVFVTAYNDRSVDSIRQLLGEDKTARWDYLSKPFSHGEILQKARNFVTLWNLQEEKKMRENQLAEAQRRLLDSERYASVAAVARGVTHEFGNILMQIMGKADLSRKKSDVEMRQAMEKILEASQRANEILERFKNLSGSGQMESHKELISLNQVVDEAVDLMEHQLRKCNIKLCKVKFEKINVYANATSLLQVFVNLIINSIYAMGNSGQIDISIIAGGTHAEVRVRDYGPGIKPELLDKVMEPFFTTKGKMGTGLGLPICREIVEIEHLGEFKIKNHGIKGLEAIIRLPNEARKEAS